MWWKTGRPSTLPQTKRKKAWRHLPCLSRCHLLALTCSWKPASLHTKKEKKKKKPTFQGWVNRGFTPGFSISSLYDLRPVSWSFQTCFPIHGNGKRDHLLTVTVNDAQPRAGTQSVLSCFHSRCQSCYENWSHPDTSWHMTPIKREHAGYQIHSSFWTEEKLKRSFNHL